ncbi:MAG: diacylglycerol kinase [Bifidobacteriaceae bacterium]|jgi:diacylglycerol kinase family enzyme|nr:diacylglycerol kinase [Bifidobacteriaceae bacterium]MCI1979100.1 diacylglycerol kinase [Bifidobacteriaceae bacterium]
MQIPVWVVVVAVIALALSALLCWKLISNALKKKALTEQIEQRDKDSVQYAFIVNPAKPNAAAITQQIIDFCLSHDIAHPLVIETQLDKDGNACAKEALARGADVVVAAGGDGTVRTAASALAGTNHAFGIIPIGTANLFARNMNIPLNDIDAALQVAISHGSRRVDMGRMALLDSDEPEHRHGFLIIAGVGFDAQMIDETDPNLKKNLGWVAYFFGGVKHLLGRKNKATITVEQEDGRTVTSENVLFRTFMAGNCGQIPGFSLMPEADYGDGLLDFELLDTTGGLIGWASLLGDVVHQTITRKAGQSPLSTNSTVEQIQGVRAELHLSKPTLAEVDGDILGETKHVELTVDQKALLVRVPMDTDLSETATIPPIKI